MPLSVSGGEKFTLSAAQKNERNILTRLRRVKATKQLYYDLWHKRKEIEDLTAHHLGLDDASACVVQHPDTWLKGQFNICVLVHVQDGDGKTRQKIFRCPMPYKVGEQYFAGTVQEKMRAEVAAYAWIENHCPEIPTPRLHAFGFSNNLQFTHHLHGPGYYRDTTGVDLDLSYLLLEYIDNKKGRMLSDTLKSFRHTSTRRMHNLFRGISRIMLSLARKPHSRIGSLRFNDDSSTTLENRPMFCSHAILESEGAPRTIDRTYTTTESFIDDMIRFRKEAFCAQPNAVNNEEDCYLQMHYLVLLRLMKPLFVDCQSDGPFVLQLTDFHASNIFVDDE